MPGGKAWFVKVHEATGCHESRESYRQNKYFLACNQHSLGTEESQFVFGRECEVVRRTEGISSLELGDAGLNHSPAAYRFYIWGENLSF